MARFLFIHQNFPGQFRHLAPALAEAGHEVRATTLRSGSPRVWNGVAITSYKLQDKPVPHQHAWLADMEAKLLRGLACLAAMREMRWEGFEPDVVVAHPGWGESLFVREVWPHTKLVMYGEFFYRDKGLDVDFDPEFPSPNETQRGKLRMRNANHLLHLDAADLVLCPTQWQASAFPAVYRDKIRVIHDGVDTHALRATPARPLTLQAPVATPGADARAARKAQDSPGQIQITPGDEVVTFVSRNLEPYRGYHTFMRALPELLRARPRLRILIIGGDEVSYGAAPPQGKTWKQIFIDEVRPRISEVDWTRVRFLGRLPYDQYLAVMALSTVHVYLTYPFVLSWSLIEAMSMGRAIVASDTAPVREVISHDVTGRLVNFFDAKALTQAVIALLDDPATRERLGRSAAELAEQRYDLQRVCLPAQQALLAGIIPGWTNSKPSSPLLPSPSKAA